MSELDSTAKEFADSIRGKCTEFRKTHVCTQEMLSYYSGLSQSAISKFERGEIPLTLESVYKLLRAFNFELGIYKVSKKDKINYDIREQNENN